MKNITIIAFSSILLFVLSSCQNNRSSITDTLDSIDKISQLQADTLYIEDLISQWVLVDDTSVIENMMQFTEDNCVAIFDGNIQMIRKIGTYYLDSNFINVEFNKNIVENSDVHYEYSFNVDTLILNYDGLNFKYVQTNFDYPITERIYDRIYEEKEGFRMVFIGDEWADEDSKMGFINSKGVEVIPVEYELVEDFEYGEAVAIKNGEQFVIDTLGNILRIE